MKKIVNPKETTRAQAFELWMKARCNAACQSQQPERAEVQYADGLVYRQGSG